MAPEETSTISLCGPGRLPVRCLASTSTRASTRSASSPPAAVVSEEEPTLTTILRARSRSALPAAPSPGSPGPPGTAVAPPDRASPPRCPCSRLPYRPQPPFPPRSFLSRPYDSVVPIAPRHVPGAAVRAAAPGPATRLPAAQSTSALSPRRSSVPTSGRVGIITFAPVSRSRTPRRRLSLDPEPGIRSVVNLGPPPPTPVSMRPSTSCQEPSPCPLPVSPPDAPYSSRRCSHWRCSTPHSSRVRCCRTCLSSSPPPWRGLALDLYLTHKQPGLLALLGKVRFDVTTRQLLRDMLIVIGLVRIPDVPPDIERPLTFCCSPPTRRTSCARPSPSSCGAPAPCPILTRNIDASALRPDHRAAPAAGPPAQPPPAALLHARHRRAAAERGAGLARSGALDRRSACSIALSLGGAVYLGTWMLPKKRHANEQQALDWLGALAGEVPAHRRHVLLRRHHLRLPGEHVALHPRPARRQADHRAARALHGAEDRRDGRPDHLHPEGRSPDAPGALDAQGDAAPGELGQDLAGAAHPHDQARLHQPRRERQALLLQPVRQGLRRGVGRRPRRPRALPARRHRRGRP